MTTWDEEAARLREQITAHELLGKPDAGKKPISRAIYKTSATTNLLLWHILQDNKNREAKLEALSEQIEGIREEVAAQLESIREEVANISGVSAKLDYLTQEMQEYYSSMFDLGKTSTASLREGLDNINGNISTI